MNSCGCHQFAVLNQPQLGGSAADVDVQYALFVVITALGSARSINSKHRLHVVSRCGANKFTPLLGQNCGNGLTVFASQSLAREDNGACIHIIRMQTRFLVGLVNDGAKCFGIHQGVTLVGGQRNRRLVNGRALHYGITA